MAAELEQKLNATVQITPGSGGVFEVEDDGILIFSKAQLGRFPNEGEIMSIVQSVGAGTPLDDAKEKASAKAQPVSISNWLTNQIKGLRRD